MNTHTLVAISTFVATSALGAQKAPDLTPYLIADRVAEVALAADRGALGYLWESHDPAAHAERLRRSSARHKRLQVHHDAIVRAGTLRSSVLESTRDVSRAG